jgi:hypothetical protein
VTGALCLLFSLFALSQRLGIAELFLGAHFLFGAPITGMDALKVESVTVIGGVLLLKGIVILGSGFVFYGRNATLNAAAPEGTAPTPQA